MDMDHFDYEFLYSRQDIWSVTSVTALIVIFIYILEEKKNTQHEMEDWEATESNRAILKCVFLPYTVDCRKETAQDWQNKTWPKIPHTILSN